MASTTNPTAPSSITTSKPLSSATEPTIDTSPISTLERRNSLEKHLQTRPEKDDLKNRHILLDTTAAPALQAAAVELERQRITDNLKKGLVKRSERESLVERNILPDSIAAPALQGQQRDLAKHMRANSLEKQLQARPKPEELIKEGVLGAEEDPLAES